MHLRDDDVIQRGQPQFIMVIVILLFLQINNERNVTCQCHSLERKTYISIL